MLAHDVPPDNPSGAPCPPGPIPDLPRCPTCGAPWPPFDARRSGVLDFVVLAQDVIADLRAALEAAVLP
jgi:hypothetical protein